MCCLSVYLSGWLAAMERKRASTHTHRHGPAGRRPGGQQDRSTGQADGRTDRHKMMDGWTDGKKDTQTDERIDGRTDRNWQPTWSRDTRRLRMRTASAVKCCNPMPVAVKALQGPWVTGCCRSQTEGHHSRQTGGPSEQTSTETASAHCHCCVHSYMGMHHVKLSGIKCLPNSCEVAYALTHTKDLVYPSIRMGSHTPQS
jgi:hypothetical protein